MAEGVLASLEKEFRPLLAPKLLAEAKAVQVVWARVKGYPAWPAQVLTEAAALRRKDLGQERHSKGNSVPVMFFGTVEVAWVKDADVVDFKEGLCQGFFDRKTKPFKLALEQVCEYLALDRKRKAPPKWWCRPPSNGHDDQSDGPSVKLASASGSGALKGTGQRQDASKASRQRSVAPETESGTSSDEDEAPAAHAAGKKAGSKPAGAKDAAAGRPAKDAAAAAPAAKPRDSSTGRLPRDNGSTAASTNTAAQAPPKKPPTAPLAVPSRQQALLKEAPSAGGAAKDGKEPRRGAVTDAKEAPPSQTSQQQQPRLRSGTGATLSAKENDAGLPPRKRLKVESAPGAVGPMAGSASNLPPPLLAAAKRTTSAGEETGGLDAAAISEIDVLKLPAEIRRLAGIRLPAIPKKPGVKVEESPRQHPQVKAEQVVASAATDGPAGASKPASVAGDSAGVEVRTARPRRTSNTSNRAGKADGGRTSGAGQGKRSRRAQSSTGEDSQSAESTDDEDAEEGQSSGEEADLEAAAGSSSDDDDGSDDSEEEEDEDESEEDTAVAAARRGGKGSGSALTRDQGTRAKPQAHSQPSRDRKGERQRRLARLALPEPANRRTSSRLVPKAQSDPVTKKAVSESADSEDDSEDESEEGEDERVSSAASSSSEGDSDSEEEPVAKELGGSDDEGIKLRSRTRAVQAAVVRPRRHSGPATHNTAGGGASQGPSREASEPADQRPKANARRADTDAGDDTKSQRREGSGAAAAPAPRALPLELRRLQNSPSAGPPAVDTSEPRTLRDRSSPARRAVGSTGVTPTQTVTAGANAGGKRVEKRGSEDGSGASMSPAADRSRSPEPRRDGQKASAAEARAPPKPSRSQALEGRSSKASSVAGSASPPPAPVPGGVPVRKKPPSLGVPGSARSTGQAGARQLPAITPARAVLRSLASTSDGVASGALPVSTCAGTSAAGTLLAPIAVCVPKKPSSGPPTRRLVEPGLDVSSTDLPDVASVICEADTKHASSPDVAAADAVAASGGPLPRSPDAVSLDGVGIGTPDEGPSTRQDAEPTTGQPPELPLPKQQQEEGALWGKGEDAAAAGGEVDAALADMPPAATDLQARPAGDAIPAAEPVPAAEAMEAAKQLAEELRRQEELIGLLDAAVTVELRPAEEPEPGATAMEQQDQIDPQPSSCCQQGCTTRAVPGPEPTEELPVLTARSSVVHDQEHEPASRSPVCPLQAALELHPAAAEQELPAQGPQAQAFSAPGSPVREETLLAEEQLPDQGEAMAEHDGGAAQAPAEPLATGCSGSGGDADPASAEQGAALAASEAPLVPSMPSPVHAGAGPSPDGRAASAGGATLAHPSPQPPCAGSRANSAAGGGDGAPAGASGTSCSVPIWGEDDDAAARARAAELEELGEVAAALAGLHQAEVPRLPLHRAASQPAPGQLPAAMQVDLLLDRGRSRGLQGSTRSAGSWEDLPVQSSGSEEGFRWPQAEPILPSLDEPFSLPRDWLLTRPPRFEPVKRNIWLSRARPKRLPKDEINICACRPPPFAAPGELQRMGCGPNCLNRLSSILCDSKLCPSGELCSNRSLHLLRQPKTEAFLTENRGWGVRALEPLSKGAFIIEYAGEVIDERELGRRMDHARMNGEPHFYIMELSAGLYIDARRKGNSARLINSSCDPNCETQKWHDASTGEVRVGIFATRDIAPGEELVYDYFFSTYGAVKQSAASFVCMCGSRNCRGTMDLHPEKRRDLGRRVEVFWDADGQYYRAVIVAYHPTSKKHTVMYEDGGTEKLCLDEVPHRWMDDEPSRISPQKPAEPRGDGAAAAQPAAAELAQSLRASGSELQQQRHQAVSVTDLADAAHLADQTGDVPITAVASQPPPRPLVAIDQRCLLPPLASSSMEAVPVHSIGGGQQQLLGKHGQLDSELQLPLKKRPRMMHQQQISQPQQHPATLPSPHSNTLSAACGRVGEAHPGFAAQQQASGGSAGCVAAPASGANRYSGGGADSAGGDAVGLSGRASLRHESSGTGSGRVSSVAAEDDDPNEDLDSLLEAAEAVAALRTAPISTVTALHAQQQQEAALPLQPRHVPSGSAGAGTVAMVQTTKAASPRHLAAAHRAGPPNGLPPHGGSRPSGTATAHPSSSSSGFIPYQVGGSRQHASGYGNSHTAQGGGPHDGGPYDHHHPYHHHQHQHHSHGRNGRFSGEHDGGAGAAAAGGARGRNGNGYGSQPNGGDINREDLLWKLVGIDKPKDLLPLFSSGCDKSRDAKGRRTGSDSWIAPSHPYGKLLRALEASELLPQAGQLRLYAQQHHQQQQEQQQHAQQQQQQQQRVLPPTPPHPPAQLPAPAVAAQQPKQPPLASVASGSATAAEPQALSVWQQLAQQQAAHTQPQAAANGASYTAHGYDNGSVATTVAAFLQQQHAAAAAAAAAASSGQLYNLHALQSHGPHAATAAAGAGAGLSGHHAGQHALAAMAAASGASHWPQPMHGQPGSIIQDLVHMYVAQHAGGSHPMLAMAGTTTVGGPRV